MLATILTLCGATNTQAQTLRGTVTDALTGEPLTGATVHVVEMDGAVAVADIDGNYKIDVKQPGRYTVESRFIGYEPSIQKEVQIVGVKEVILDILLRENANKLTEVVVKPRVNKMATVNPTALVGGVFDMKMRSGNNAKHENILQVGTVSEELTLEGPLSRKSNSSYIFNYRYGFTSLASKLGILNVLGTDFDFMDFSLKLNFPTKRAGTFSLFGLGFYDKADDQKPELEDVHSIYDVSDQHFKMWNLVAGASHRIHLAGKWTWRTTLAYNMQHDKLDTDYRYFDQDATGAITRFTGQEAPFYYLKQNEDRLILNTELSKQVTPKWLTQVGGEYSQRFFNIIYTFADATKTGR